MITIPTVPIPDLKQYGILKQIERTDNTYTVETCYRYVKTQMPKYYACSGHDKFSM